MEKEISLDRRCPFCQKDCGQKSQNYPFSVIIEAECKNCGAPITNDFKYPDFFWKMRNWYMKKNKDGSCTITPIKKIRTDEK